MSLYANISPRIYALVYNPVKLSIESSDPATYQIEADGEILFSGSVEAGNTDVFIDEILAEMLSPTRYAQDKEHILLSPSGNMKEYSIHLVNETGDELDLVHTVFLGGISKRALRSLEGNNIFTFKFLNPAGNFFMTTRSEERIITIKETELYPLLFIAPTSLITVKADDLSIEIPLDEGRCYALNLEAIRYHFFSRNNILANYFKIVTGKGTIEIAITAATMEKDRYFLEFLNSYGAYELIEITGKPTMEQEPGEDNLFKKYDPDVNDFVDHRDRVPSKTTLQAHVRVNTKDELTFVLDMLSSDDIHLIGYEENTIKVHPQTDSLSYIIHSNVPQSIPITLKFADDETLFTNNLAIKNFGNVRIFTDIFSNTFN